MRTASAIRTSLLDLRVRDARGYTGVADATDRDDVDETIHPGATEVCDDCDDIIDPDDLPMHPPSTPS